MPPRGGELVFRPLDHLQPVKYSRPGLSLLGFGETILDNGFTSAEINKVDAWLSQLYSVVLFPYFPNCKI